MRFHKARQNLLVNFGSLSDIVLWEAMMLENVGKEQPPRLLSRCFILSGNEVRHLAKSIHHNHDGIESP
jgi:hypothetical protein